MTQSYAALPHTSITLYVVYQALLLFELGEKPNMPATDALAKFGKMHGQVTTCVLFRCIAG